MSRPGAEPDPAGRRMAGHRRWVLIGALVVLLAAATGLGIWWVHLRGGVDPVGDDPVSASGIVRSSPACGSPGRTVVDIVGAAGSQTSIDGCNFIVGGWVAIEYRPGRIDVARLAGTRTVGAATVPAWVPLAILVAGVLAVAATLVLLLDRRGRVGTGRAGGDPVADPSTGAGISSVPPDSAVVLPVDEPAGVDPVLRGPAGLHPSTAAVGGPPEQIHDSAPVFDTAEAPAPVFDTAEAPAPVFATAEAPAPVFATAQAPSSVTSRAARRRAAESDAATAGPAAPSAPSTAPARSAADLLRELGRSDRPRHRHAAADD